MKQLANIHTNLRAAPALCAGNLRAYVFALVVAVWCVCSKTIMVTISD